MALTISEWANLYQELLTKHLDLLVEHRKLLQKLAEFPSYPTEPIPLMERYEGDDRVARTAPMIGADPFATLAAEMAEEARLLESAVGVANIEMH